MGKIKGFSTYKHSTTSQITKGCKQRQVERSALLTKQFSAHSLRRLIFQNEKDFPHEVSLTLHYHFLPLHKH